MQLLISDSNILIDFEDGHLLNALFSLEESLAVPDILYEEELRDQHPHLLALGLVTLELQSTTILRAIELTRTHRRPSRNDLFALALAEQEGCPLLSGDKDLRSAAVAEGIQVHGTLWIMERLVKTSIVTPKSMREAYARMRYTGRRLPWRIVNTRLAALGQQAV